MITAVLQARMSSTRLPGKVLRPILGRAMMARQLDRLHRSSRIDRIVVATSDEPIDDAIVELCKAEGVSHFRGSLTNVLSRVYHAAAENGPATHVVRLTADCPLADWEIIDACIDLHLSENADCTSNATERSYPDGLDVEVVSMPTLTLAQREATDKFDLEHVTPFIYRSPERFKIRHIVQEPDLAELRWTVDNLSDFTFVERIFAHFLPTKKDFLQKDILEFIQHAGPMPHRIR